MNEQNIIRTVPHYYGDIVRYLFILAAMIMVIGLPAIHSFLGLPVIFSTIAILFLGVAAGVTNPKQKWAAGLNVGISILGFIVFESYAVLSFTEHSASSSFFIANISLGLLFLICTYFSVKTFRGFLLGQTYE